MVEWEKWHGGAGSVIEWHGYGTEPGAEPGFLSGGQKNIESGLNSLSDLNPLTNWVLDKK